MGQHYVPQRYLRGFADDHNPEMIWTYDKQQGTYRLLPIKAVAQSSDFYTQEAEDFLNRKIEMPARKPFEQLESGQNIDDVDRLIVAIYIQVAVLRVPRTRKILLGLVRRNADAIVAEMKSDPSEVPIGMSTAEFAALLDKRLEEIIRYGPSGEPMRNPWIQRDLVELMFSMTWRIARLSDSETLLTGDNPVFFTDSFGLMHRDGEITFPISRKTVLHASWQGPWSGLLFTPGSSYAAGEINRRTATTAERFVFASNDDLDVKALVEKPPPLLYPFPW